MKNPGLNFLQLLGNVTKAEQPATTWVQTCVKKSINIEQQSEHLNTFKIPGHLDHDKL